LEKLKKERLISMSTSKILYQISKLVKEILENDKRARNSDTYLYLQVLYKVGLIKGIDVNAMSVTEFLLKRNELGFPCYETCSRARRKVQEEHPELAGSDDVEAQRIINERVFRDYARRKRSE
jgi:hypothetical protein